MKNYLDLMQDILDNGIDHQDRTGTGRRSVFGRQLRFKMSDGFPLMTTRKIPTKTIIVELLWFISGARGVNFLKDNNVTIWDLWTPTDEDADKLIEKYDLSDKDNMVNYIKGRVGTIGGIYGPSWRHTKVDPTPATYIKMDNLSNEELLASDELDAIASGFSAWEPPPADYDYTLREAVTNIAATKYDQLFELIKSLKNNPYSARHILSGWDVNTIPKNDELSPKESALMGTGALAPCHILQHYTVRPPLIEGGKKRLSLLMYQRSCDVPVGGPFNVAQYSILLNMVAQVVDMEPYEFVWSIGDAHIYLNQIEGVKEQVTREPLPLPKLVLNPDVKDLFSFTLNDIKIEEYQHLEHIKYDVSV